MPEQHTVSEDDGRGKFPAALKIAVSRDMPARVRQAAEARGTTVADFVRSTLDAAIQSAPAPGLRAERRA